MIDRLKRQRPAPRWNAACYSGMLRSFVARAFFMLLLFLACAAATKAQLLDYGNYSGYGIMKGILGNDYTTPLAACITGTEKDEPQDAAGFRASIVYTADEYKQAFHIDQQAQASFLGIASGSEELHLGRETSRSGSSFDIIVEAYGQHPYRTVNNVKWDPKYQVMLDSGDPVQKQQVRQDCGDRYVETVFKETRLFAVMHVSSQQNSSLTQFAGKANGSVGISIVTASASLGGDSNISSAYKSGAITVDVYTEGLGGISPTAGMIGITSANGLQDIADKLAAYMPKLPDVGQPVKVQLAPLPGVNTGSLSDVRVFDYLNALKLQYANTDARLENVHSLLTPSDPRRLLFRQPDADTALKQQQEKLTANLDAVAVAHDRCRKAFSLPDCEGIAKAFATPLAWSSVELMPLGEATIPSFVFAIDGTPVPPGQTDQLSPKAGKTLLEEARMLKPEASSVDLLAPVFGGDYLASIFVPVFVPHAKAPPSLVGSLTLRGQDLALPAYLKGPFRLPPTTATIYPSIMVPEWGTIVQSPPALRVLHADAEHPCGTSTAGGVVFWEEGCLTALGHALWTAVLAEVASNQTNPVITQPVFGFAGYSTNWSLSDCFGNRVPIVSNFTIIGSSPAIDWFQYNYNPGIKGQVAAKAVLSVYTGGGNYLALAGEDEVHDPATWARLAKQRLDALAAAQGGPGGGPNPCAPHIP